MTPERWQMVRGILESALDLRPTDRAQFLERECASDPLLRKEIDEYLSLGGKLESAFLESPAAQHVVSGSTTSAGDTLVAAGTRFGPYEIQELIGAGGMGEVYRARDTRLDRVVALKLIPRSLASDTSRRQRFERESRAIAALQHPNICTVHDIGQQDGVLFLVMEYLQGETLAKRLQKGRLPLDQALRYTAEITDALDAAHRKGIIHRDLKPANIFLTAHGECKVLDFGLAKLDEPQTVGYESAATVADVRLLTMPGVVMGTAPYMSPEQARGEALDARSDVFSLGAVLYEMVTGNMAFSGKTTAMVHKAILDETPPMPSTIVPTIPEQLDHIVGKALEKDRDLRYQGAADLRTDLNRMKRDIASGRIEISGAATRSVPRGTEKGRRSRARTRWLFASVLALAIVALASWWYLRSHNFLRSRLGIASIRVSPLTQSGDSMGGAITRDGKYVAYVKADLDNEEVRLLQVATRRDVQLVASSPFQIWGMHFSQDGNFIYMTRAQKAQSDESFGIYRVATLGGPLTPIATDADMGGLTIAPDGKQIAYRSHTSSESIIVLLDADGQNRRILAKRPRENPFNFLDWSHSGDFIAASVWQKSGAGLVKGGLVKIEVPSGRIHELSMTGWGGTTGIGQPAWSGDDREIYAPASEERGEFSEFRQIWAFDADTGNHRRLTSGLTSYDPWTLSVTDSGDLLANPYTSTVGLWTSDHSSKMHSITSQRADGLYGVTWLDDYVITTQGRNLTVHDLNHQTSSTIVSYSRSYYLPVKCGPTQVAYRATGNGLHLHIARTDILTGATVPLTNGPQDDEPSCTPDGSTLVFSSVSKDGKTSILMRKSLASGQSVELYHDDRNWAWQPKISPDGKTVLFLVSPKSGEPPYWATIPTEGGNVRRVQLSISPSDILDTRSDTQVIYGWAPDGKSIIYVKNDKAAGNLWSVPLSGGSPKRLTEFTSDDIYAFGVSPDNRMAVSRGRMMYDLVLLQDVK